MQTNRQEQSETNGASVEKLQECLGGELSAVETYELALRSVTNVGLRHTLHAILGSHTRRTEQLRETLGWSGARPRNGAGVWGPFARAVQGGAELAGNAAAFAALEESEGDGIKLYTAGLDDCDEKTRKLIDTVLLPEQQRTHDLCAALKRSLARRAPLPSYDDDAF